VHAADADRVHPFSVVPTTSKILISKEKTMNEDTIEINLGLVENDIDRMNRECAILEDEFIVEEAILNAIEFLAESNFIVVVGLLKN
jgi:hypothetical protein